MLSIFSTADSIYGYTFKGTLFIIIEINFLTKPIKSVKKQLPNEFINCLKMYEENTNTMYSSYRVVYWDLVMMIYLYNKHTHFSEHKTNK